MSHMANELDTMRLRILLMTDHRERAALLERALSAVRRQVVAAIRPDDDLCSYVRQARPDAVVVSLVAADPALVRQLEQLSRDQPLPVVMFTDRSDSVALRAMVKAGVSAYVVDGLQAARVGPVLDTALARFLEFQALRRERDAAVTRLCERKRIERAKSILMHRRGLSEKAAFAALRKMANVTGKSLPEMAQYILALEAALAGEVPPDDANTRVATVSAASVSLFKAFQCG
jgi:response regulator NasT